MIDVISNQAKPKLDPGKYLGLLFILLGVLLIMLIAGHWLVILEPRLETDAESRAAALAHAQAGAIAKTLSFGSVAQRRKALAAELDGILRIKDPSSDTPYILGIEVRVDYGEVDAPAKALDLVRGDIACDNCFKTLAPLYHQNQPNIIGIATFHSSQHFLHQLISSVRGKLFLGAAATLLLIIAAWAGSARLTRRLRQSEANLREVFEAAPFPMMLHKSEQIGLSRANRAAIDYLQLTRNANGRYNSSAWNTLRKNSLPQCQDVLRETEINTPDQQRWALLSTIPVRFSDTDSQLISLADISKLKQTQAELTQAKEAAEAATQAKSTFLATMSHEIRTPLNAVLGMAHLLARADLPKAEQEYVQYIQHAGDALLALVSDILDFNQIESGRMALEVGEFNVGELLQDTLTVLAPSARQKGLMLESHVPASLQRQYLGDKNRIRQVLINLLGNAVKFTQNGYIRLEALILEQSPQGDTIEVRISDTGIGIAKESLPTLFDEFTQSDASVSRRYGGAGLGLAICRRLIQLMDGQIGVQSQIDKGSCFWFRLQLASTQTPAPVPQRDASKHPSRAPLHVLVVDDEPISRLFLQSILGASGHLVELAQNGLEAIEILQKDRFDIILLDLRMPEINGFETARRIRAFADADRAATCIIALTADVTDQTAEKCRAAGINDVAAKPIAPEQLEQLLETYSASGESGGGPHR